MSNSKILTTPFILILLSIILGCEDNSTFVRNSFTCEIDGEVFTPKNDDWKGDPAIEGTIEGGTLIITGRNNVNGSSSVGIKISNFSGPGTYILNDVDENYGRYYSSEIMSQCFTNTDYTGELIIESYEAKEGIVWGKFNFEAATSNGSKVVAVTQGQFIVDCAVL